MLRKIRIHGNEEYQVRTKVPLIIVIGSFGQPRRRWIVWIFHETSKRDLPERESSFLTTFFFVCSFRFLFFSFEKFYTYSLCIFFVELFPLRSVLLNILSKEFEKRRFRRCSRAGDFNGRTGNELIVREVSVSLFLS